VTVFETESQTASRRPPAPTRPAPLRLALEADCTSLAVAGIPHGTTNHCSCQHTRTRRAIKGIDPDRLGLLRSAIDRIYDPGAGRSIFSTETGDCRGPPVPWTRHSVPVRRMRGKEKRPQSAWGGYGPPIGLGDACIAPMETPRRLSGFAGFFQLLGQAFFFEGFARFLFYILFGVATFTHRQSFPGSIGFRSLKSCILQSRPIVGTKGNCVKGKMSGEAVSAAIRRQVAGRGKGDSSAPGLRPSDRDDIHLVPINRNSVPRERIWQKPRDKPGVFM
jgi:hypothetical protein